MEPIRMELEGYQCPCPGTPHSSEWVEMEPETTIPMVVAAQHVIYKLEREELAVFYGAVTPALMRFGIREWSFMGDKGPLEITGPNIAAIIGKSDFLNQVSVFCLDRYLPDILHPLVQRRSRPSVPGLMADTMSPTPESGPKPLISPSRSSHKPTDGKPSEAPAP